MRRRIWQESLPKWIFRFVLLFCALMALIALVLGLGHAQNDLHSFAEPVLSLSQGWEITDSEGGSRALSLPETIEYGHDGVYTLTTTLPATGGELISPALCVYSNYIDLRVALDGEELYGFPFGTAAFSGATGNTYHFVRLPADYAGKTLRITLCGQLGADITYLLTPPRLGSKATMLKQEVIKSLPSLMLSGSMGLLALGLGVLYLAFRKHVQLSDSNHYIALFALLFSLYVFFETSFAQLLLHNGYLLCYATLTLLAVLPIPLIGVFADSVATREKPWMYGLMLLSCANLAGQTLLNFSGVMSVRAMLPATHVVLVLSIIVGALCMLLSSRTEKPEAHRSLYSATPMIAGGIADITLINLNMPSYNNSFYFTLGVTIFVLIQLYGFIRSYAEFYHRALESKLLSDMAYHDTLSGIENRNAYEQKLKELCAVAPSPRLCCIVTDINNLKLINDTLGHLAGDTAIAQVGMLLRGLMPNDAAYFRTGGDEFVILLDNCDEKRIRELAETLVSEAARRGARCGIPISLAVGAGQYAPEDGNIVDFIRRIDTLMYECKRLQKGIGRSAPERRGKEENA